MTQNLFHFGNLLSQSVKRKRNPVCVGLDPRLESLPPSLIPLNKSDHGAVAEAFKTFCFEIIDVVCLLVPVVKPQVAFFEQYGPQGMLALQQVIAYATSKDLLVIADAKRGDIGTTAEAYAKAFMGRNGQSPFGADCLTVNPYLGEDSISPFVDRAMKTSSGIFVLVKTSNPGSGFIQDLQVGSSTVSERMADWVQSQSIAELASFSTRDFFKTPMASDSDNRYGSIGAVVGATYPEQLEHLRARMPNAWLLIPGYGAQGGSAREVVAGFDSEGLGAIVNNSRGIIFAHQSEKYRHLDSWQHAVEASTRDMIEALAAETTVKHLSAPVPQ